MVTRDGLTLLAQAVLIRRKNNRPGFKFELDECGALECTGKGVPFILGQATRPVSRVVRAYSAKLSLVFIVSAVSAGLPNLMGRNARAVSPVDDNPIHDGGTYQKQGVLSSAG